MGSHFDYRLANSISSTTLNLYKNHYFHQKHQNNLHHQHACLRVLLPVWRHDCHQHHLHRLRPQAVPCLPHVLNCSWESLVGDDNGLALDCLTTLHDVSNSSHHVLHQKHLEI